MKKFSLFLLLIFRTISIYSVDLNLDNSAFSNACGSLGFLQNYPSEISFNPSFFKTGVETSVTALFSLKDLTYYNLFVGKKAIKTNFTLGISSLATDLYSENRVYSSLSKKFLGINFGVSAKIIMVKISDFKVGYSVNIGLNKRFKKFAMAFAFHNITNAKFQGEHLPVNLIYETNFTISKNISISLGLEKQIGYDFIFLFGGIYRINNRFALFSGYRLNPNRIGLGCKISIKKIRVSYSILTHTDLPLTHYISLIYAF